MNGPLDALDGFYGAFIIHFVEHFHVFPFKRYLERQRHGGVTATFIHRPAAL